MSEVVNDMVVGVVVCDLERSGIGTRSRLGDAFCGESVLRRVVGRLLLVAGVGEVVLLVPKEQMDRVWEIVGPEDRVRVMELERRSESLDGRVRRSRAWNLLAWRGGAGQWTFFDEEYHPAAIARACREAHGGSGADHVLVVHSHAVMLDMAITSQLVQHHLHKNHEMRVTYTPAAPGLSGMVLRADIVREMGDKGVMPGQLLAYDPASPTFDTLIREACMQVDPALSKIPNRFCVDTQRAWAVTAAAAAESVANAAEMCLLAARTVAPGVRDLTRVFDWPREVQMELTGARLTKPPGSFAGDAHVLDARHWVNWFARESLCDDLLLTIGGDGDPLLYEGLTDVLRAARAAKVLGICVQTDLAGGDVEGLLGAIGEGLVDVVSVAMYGHTSETYARVAGADLHAVVMKNMERLAEVVASQGGLPLVIPRLLKVRETIPEMEAFFDFWVQRCGWAVIDGPTDRAGSVAFAGVVDMAPPKRKACRRIWERMMVRPDGTAVACDQDVAAKLHVGNIETMGIQEMWGAMNGLRELHAAGRWNEMDPCRNCREWHRA